MSLTNAQLALLSLVAEKPRYGYEIEQTIEERGMREWTEIGFSSIYYLLNKLQERGLLESRVEAQSERPNRRVYEITETGRTAYREAVAEYLCRLRAGDFELGLANLRALPAGQVASILEERRSALIRQIEKVRSKWNRDRQQGIPLHIEALFDHSLARLQAELDWVERWEERMKAEG